MKADQSFALKKKKKKRSIFLFLLQRILERIQATALKTKDKRFNQWQGEPSGEAAGLQRRKRAEQFERRERKRERGEPQPHFYSNIRVKRRHSRSRPSLFLYPPPFLYYPPLLALPLPLPIPFRFLPLPSRHASSHLQPRLLYPRQVAATGEV